jgi:hypothetical protein
LGMPVTMVSSPGTTCEHGVGRSWGKERAIGAAMLPVRVVR